MAVLAPVPVAGAEVSARRAVLATMMYRVDYLMEMITSSRLSAVREVEAPGKTLPAG